MLRRFPFLLIVLVCTVLAALSLPSPSRADTYSSPRYADTPYDLVNGVNALRAANGLAPYSINSILMYTAQAQADFMAATGNITHSGPGGVGVTDRLLAAGYPLAGDLSLGGFRSENITGGGEGMSAQDAVEQWTGDAPHLNTMLSPNLTEIGAGVAVVNGRVYYVIDCARPTNAGAPPAAITPIGGGSAVPANEAPIQSVVVSTPNPDGNVIHEVKYGQTLWQIAISYGTKIDEIKRLNNLSGDDIYPGEKLLVRMGVLQPSSTPTEPPTSEPEATSIVTSTATFIPPAVTMQSTVTMTVVVVPVASPPENKSVLMGTVVGIIVLALLGGGVITWMNSSKKENP
jgi:uncharacterized protein YkwD